MYRIVKKQVLNPTVTRMDIEAPLIAKKAEPGQFIILRVDEKGERIPLTVGGLSTGRAGTVTIIFQIVGATTEKLNHLEEGDCLQDFVGPLGRPLGDGGLEEGAPSSAAAWAAPSLTRVAKALHEQGAEVDVIIGFRNKDLVILEEEFRGCQRQRLS